MKKIIQLIKNLFSKDIETIDLLGKSKKEMLAEVGGNYCSDTC